MDYAPTDEDLVARSRLGDARAYAELVRRHEVTAFRAAYLITRSAQDAEEAAQDGFVKAWKALGRFKSGAPFRPWLLRIVKNEALNRVRSRARRDRAGERLSAEPAGVQGTAESEALDAVRRETLEAAVERLPERHRLVIQCLYLLGLSEQETATVLRIPRGTVKSRASTARHMLAEQLEGLT